MKHLARRKAIVAIMLLGLLGTGGIVSAETATGPQWVVGERLVGVFGVSNGDVLIISTQYNQVIFTYQYADATRPNLVDYRYYPFQDRFDQVSASVCGNVAHVVTHSSIGNGLYSLSWMLPIEHTTYLPVVICGAQAWPNN